MVAIQKQKYFVTGTNTEVGKTTVCAALLLRAQKMGGTCFAIKPISSGAKKNELGKLMSFDAELLKQYSTVQLHDDLVAPFIFEPAIAPNIAAKLANTRLNAERTMGMLRAALFTPASHVLVEGVGGWHVPLNHQETMAILVKQLQLPVIMVVKIQLGCINHALLTQQAIAASGLELAGWVANQMECTDNTTDFGIQVQQEIIQTLKTMLQAPCLGEIPKLVQHSINQRIQVMSELLRWPNES